MKKFYSLDIDESNYSWYDWMLEEGEQQTEDEVEGEEPTVKTLKIDVPDGYVVDEEKSTFKEIVFKKQSAIITWNFIHNGVEIATDSDRFVIRCDGPAFYCTWNDARRYFQDVDYWVIPSVNQLKVVKKHLNEINKVIRDHYGYTLCGKSYWSNDDGDSNTAKTAKCVNLKNGMVCCDDKDECQNVVNFVKNI